MQYLILGEFALFTQLDNLQKTLVTQLENTLYNTTVGVHLQILQYVQTKHSRV